MSKAARVWFAKGLETSLLEQILLKFWVELHHPFETFWKLWKCEYYPRLIWESRWYCVHFCNFMHKCIFWYALKSNGSFKSCAVHFHADCCHSSSLSIPSILFSFSNKIPQFQSVLNFICFSCPVYLAYRCAEFNYKTKLEYEKKALIVLSNFNNKIKGS